MCENEFTTPNIGALSTASIVFLDEFYSCPGLYKDYKNGLLPYRQVGNVPLKSVSAGRFEYADETVASFGEYHHACSSIKRTVGSCVDVFVFHSAVKGYGKSSVCFFVPSELSERLKERRYETMWVIQLFRYGEEDRGPQFTYQKYMRKTGHTDCIPIPQMLSKWVSRDGLWTIGITSVLVGIPPQYDGFVYPCALEIGDVLGVTDFLNINK